MSLRSSGKETSREARELSPLGDFSDEDMKALLANVRRKKPRLKNSTDELSMELSSVGTEHTPLLKGKTSLRPRQRSLSTSLSPTATEKNVEPSRSNSDLHTPKRSHASHSRSGEISVPKRNRQHKAYVSASASKAPLPDHLPSPPSTASKNDLLSPAPRDHKETTPPELETYSPDDSSESSSEEGHEREGVGRKPVDPEEKNEVSQALKDMTSVLNKLVKQVESNSNEIHALKSTLQSCNTPSSSSESSGSRKRKIPAVVRVCTVHVIMCTHIFLYLQLYSLYNIV